MTSKNPDWLQAWIQKLINNQSWESQLRLKHQTQLKHRSVCGENQINNIPCFPSSGSDFWSNEEKHTLQDRFEWRNKHSLIKRKASNWVHVPTKASDVPPVPGPQGPPSCIVSMFPCFNTWTTSSVHLIEFKAHSISESIKKKKTTRTQRATCSDV